jgi:hypothetical protein
MTPVTDPALLAQLNGGNGPSGLTPVTDPELLKQLNAQPNAAADVAKGGVKGVTEGVEGLAGLPGDAAHLATSLFQKIPGQLGLVNSIRGMMGKAPITQQQSDDVNAQLQPSGYVGSKTLAQYGSDNLPSPETSLGQHVENVASFLPAAVGGPESLAANLLKRGVAPGVASDALGTLAQGTPLETPARIAGAFLSPSGNKARLAAEEAVTPTAQALTDAGGAGRNAFRATPFAVRDGVMQDWAQRLTDNYNKDFDPRGFGNVAAPETNKFLGDIANQKGAFWQDSLDALQGGANSFDSLIARTNGADKAAAIDAKKAFTARMSQPFTTGQTLVGNPAASAKIWNDAQANYAAGMRSGDVDQLMNSALIKASTENSGLGSGNTLKKAVANFAKNSDNLWGFNEAEKQAMLDMAKGNTMQNATRSLSNRLGGGGGIGSVIAGRIIGGGLGGAAGAAEGGPEGSLVGTGAGTLGAMVLGALARNHYNRSVANTGAAMSRMIRSRSPLGAGMPMAPTSMSPIVQSLLRLHQASQMPFGQ